MPSGPENQRFVGVAGNVSGSSNKIFNVALTTYIDNQDGNGPQLQTVFVQAVACWPIDPSGNLMEWDEVYPTAKWKTQVLDELRAIRLGLQLLVQPPGRVMQRPEEELIDMALALRFDDDENDNLNGGQLPVGGP